MEKKSSQVMHSNDVLTVSLSSCALVYGLRFGFSRLMYSFGLLTFKQSKNLSNIETNLRVSTVSVSS